MRLLLEPSSKRFEHRFRLIVNAPAGDGCSTIGAPATAPRCVVGEAAPRYAWHDDSSFPHG